MLYLSAEILKFIHRDFGIFPGPNALVSRVLVDSGRYPIEQAFF